MSAHLKNRQESQQLHLPQSQDRKDQMYDLTFNKHLVSSCISPTISMADRNRLHGRFLKNNAIMIRKCLSMKFAQNIQLQKKINKKIYISQLRQSDKVTIVK